MEEARRGDGVQPARRTTSGQVETESQVGVVLWLGGTKTAFEHSIVSVIDVLIDSRIGLRVEVGRELRRKKKKPAVEKQARAVCYA